MDALKKISNAEALTSVCKEGLTQDICAQDDFFKVAERLGVFEHDRKKLVFFRKECLKKSQGLVMLGRMRSYYMRFRVDMRENMWGYDVQKVLKWLRTVACLSEERSS